MCREEGRLQAELLEIVLRVIQGICGFQITQLETRRGCSVLYWYSIPFHFPPSI